MKPSYIPLIIVGSALSLTGQQTFSGPASGYVFDSVQQSIRPILGVPGAASLGPQSGTAAEPPWDTLSVAPNGRRALGVSGLSLSLIPNLSEATSFTSIGQADGPGSRIVWSGDSTTAAIWSQATGQLRRITALDSTPVVHDPIDLTALSATLSGWSLSPNGRYVALSSLSLRNASVYLSDSDGSPVPIGYLPDPGAVAFSPDGASLFVVSGSKRQILMFDIPSGAVAGSFDTTSFASGVAVAGTGSRDLRGSPGPATSRIQDLAVSADGAKLYAISGKTLCNYDLATGQLPSCSTLEVLPRSFQSMSGGIFLLSYPRAGNMPLWLLDGRTGQTWFVPAGDATANASF